MYTANFYANNGTTFIDPLTGSNKREIISHIRQTASAERFAGNTAKWYVWRNGKCVAAGYIDDSGYHRYDDLRYFDCE